jgi:hypothetical protein
LVNNIIIITTTNDITFSRCLLEENTLRGIQSLV